MRLTLLVRVAQGRCREWFTDRCMPQPLRIRRTNVHHGVMHVCRDCQDETPTSAPSDLRRNGSGRSRMCIRSRLVRGSSPVLASSRRDLVEECSSPEPTGEVVVHRCESPAGAPPSPMRKSLRSVAARVTNRSRTAHIAGRQTTAASSSSRRREQRHPPKGESARRSRGASAQLLLDDGRSGSGPEGWAGHPCRKSATGWLFFPRPQHRKSAQDYEGRSPAIATLNLIHRAVPGSRLPCVRLDCAAGCLKC